MNKIYLLVGKCVTDSSTNVWTVCAYFDRELAKQHAYLAADASPEEVDLYDPYCKEYSDGNVTYYVMESEVRVTLPNPNESAPVVKIQN